MWLGYEKLYYHVLQSEVLRPSRLEPKDQYIPQVVMVKVFSQNLGFNPSADTLTTPAG